MRALIFDTETTGLDAPEVIEAAWMYAADGATPRGALHSERYKPSKPISLGAMAAHGIMDEDLVDYLPSGSFRLPADTGWLIGHNIDYDWQAIGSPDVKRICTLALSRKLWPQADSHTLAAMMYLTRRDTARELVRNAHSAAADVENCARLLDTIIGEVGWESWEALWRYSEAARVPEIFTFGKHKGMRIKDAPRDYRQWMLRQPDIDPYLRQALTA